MIWRGCITKEFMKKFLAALAGLILLSAGGICSANPSGGGFFDYAPEMRQLKGSFFQPFLVTEWQQDIFDAKYEYLAANGMDHVIWQWTADSGKKEAFYPTQLGGWTSPQADLVEMSLKGAKKAGIKVWLGLNWTDEWWSHYANDARWLEREFAVGRLVARELWLRYGDKYADTIAGFYITMEVDNVGFTGKKQQQRMADVYRKSVDFVHDCTGKPVMVAPFFSDGFGMNPQQYAAMWSKILKQAPIDVIAMQDGVGVDHVTVANVGKWFAVMQKMIAETRPETELWSDMETLKADFTSADNARIVEQIEAERQYVKKITTFAVLHYQMPPNVERD